MNPMLKILHPQRMMLNKNHPDYKGEDFFNEEDEDEK